MKMAGLLTSIVTRGTLLSALEEKRRHQMKKYLLHRLFFVAMLREEVFDGQITAYHEQLFQRIYKFHLGEPASGVLLIYSNCILHILEASSGTLYHILKDLATFETKGPEALLRDVKILVMSHNIPTRLFTQWYATKVDVPVSLEDVTQSQTTEEVITECLTLILKLGVYLATLKVGNKGLSDCLHAVVPELLIPAETIHCLCRAKECLSPASFSICTATLCSQAWIQKPCGPLLVICLHETLQNSLRATGGLSFSVIKEREGAANDEGEVAVWPGIPEVQ